MPTKIDISYRTMVFVTVFLFSLWFLFQIRQIIFLLFISFILMSAIRPLVGKIERLRIPRFFAIIIVYFFLILFLGGIITSLIPPLVNESVRLINLLPLYSESLFKFLNINVDFFTQQITNVGGNILKITLGIFTDLVTTITLLVFTFYLLLEREHLEDYLISFLGEPKAKETAKIIRKIEERLGAWFRGQLILCTVIGVMSFIGLKALGLPYALPLSLVAGILEIVPMVGPIVSAIPAVFFAFLTSPALALATAALYFIIQQLENNLIVPKVMQSTIGLKPIITILALMIGGKLLGILGAVLAIPVVLVFQTVFRQISEKR